MDSADVQGMIQLVPNPVLIFIDHNMLLTLTS